MLRPRPILPEPVLMLVTDGLRSSRAGTLEDVVRQAVAGGMNVVHVREKHLSTAELVTLGTRMRDAIEGHALLFVNGNIDAALDLGADGIHLPASGRAVSEAAARCGERMLVSRAAHSIEAAVRAERDGADAVVLGTIFPSPSHPQGPTLGLDGIRGVCGRVHAPVIGIGGITSTTAGDVMHAGASGIAVIGAIFGSDDAREAAVSLQRAVSSPVRS